MPEKVKLDGFKTFIGRHCETTALKRVLDYKGLDISEEMLFGLGGGIGFIYWYIKTLPAPFIGSRHGKVADFLKNICRRIGVNATISETSSPKRGYDELKSLLHAGEPAIVYGDMVSLPYLVMPDIAHFGGHAFVVFGIDEAKGEVYIYDRSQNTFVISIDELAKARSSKYPPFAPKHKLISISRTENINSLEDAIKESIRECCRDMIEPSIRNIGLPGIEKWSTLVLKWPEKFHDVGLLNALINGFTYIEIAGTGGSAFRSMYARFLEESGQILNRPAILEAAALMWQSAAIWSDIASCFMPDSLPALGQMRKLMTEKNRLFEEQGPDAVSTMTVMQNDIQELAYKSLGELRSPLTFLSDAEQRIIRCHQIESAAFNILAREVSQAITVQDINIASPKL